MLTENQTPTASAHQLFFCYNKQQNDILYSNISLDNFFGSTIRDLRKLSLFIHRGWKDALELKPGEEYSFSFTPTEVNEQFNCSVKMVEMPAGGGSAALMMCTVARTEDKSGRLNFDQFQEFLHLATHDLDAPLRKINLLTERLGTKIKPDEDGAEILQRIGANIKDMRALIDGVSKLSGLFETESTTMVDLNSLVSGLLASIRKTHPGKDITSETGPLPVVEGNEEAYRELFYNLIENAVLFSGKDIVFVSIQTAETSETEKASLHLKNGTKFYKIIVQDKGIGFDRQDAGKIFQPFTRLHGKSTYPGSGLGLAICKRIVENHHGAIYAEGVEGEGASFILFLPQSLN